MRDEIDRTALEQLLQKVADRFCGEADRNTFRMTGNLQIELALEGKFARDRSIVSDRDAFTGADAKMWVEIAALIAGSVKAFFEIRKLMRESFKKDDPQAMSLVWQKRLIDEGVSPEKAQAIVSEFKDEIGTVVK